MFEHREQEAEVAQEEGIQLLRDHLEVQTRPREPTSRYFGGQRFRARKHSCLEKGGEGVEDLEEAEEGNVVLQLLPREHPPSVS